MNLTQKAHSVLENFLACNKNCFAIDATAGNGFDTLFLASNPNVEKVFAFDIQEAALVNTKNLLRKNCIDPSKYTTFLESHENWKSSLKEDAQKISLAVFNLGWLPNSDKKICTNASITLQTLIGITAHFESAKKPAILSVLSYRGHEEGEKEYGVVQNFFTSIKQRVEIFSDKNNVSSPVLFIAHF